MNQPRVFIIHGWNATPRDAWVPWLKRELEERGIDVYAPQMPNPRWPYIRRWMTHLKNEVGDCNEETYFVGHSLGGQAILRYLARLPSGQSAGGAIFVGGFDRLRVWWPYLIGAYICLGRWLLQPIDWKRVRIHAKRFCAVFSDDDGWVLDESSGCFREHLRAKVRLLHGYGHFTGDEGVFCVPEVLDELLRMIEQKEPSDRVTGRLPENVLFNPLTRLHT
jgi:uncharacterized protein